MLHCRLGDQLLNIFMISIKNDTATKRIYSNILIATLINKYCSFIKIITITTYCNIILINFYFNTFLKVLRKVMLQ